MAQSSDLQAPTITIATPQDGQAYKQGAPVTASYTCTDASTVALCEGPVADGAAINTSALGNFTFTVNARDSAGNTSSLTRNYSVVPADGDVTGTTPATLNLTLGQPGAFSPFIPGVARSYTTSMTANVTSSAENAALTVADPSATATGRLMNGTFALVSPLQVGAASTYEYVDQISPMGPVGSSAAPATLLTYDGPVGLDPVTLNFKQAIGETEALRTGGYSKTLTFTLSTTKP